MQSISAAVEPAHRPHNVSAHEIAKTAVYSPSALSSFLACPHLTALEVAIAGGELERPLRINRHADLIRAKGEQHETAYLQRLHSEGRDIVETERSDGAWDWDA